MYKIYANGQLIHAPKRFADGYVVIKASITQEPNAHGSMTFTVAPGHPCYDDFKLLTTYITVYDDTEELFYGRVIEVTRDFYNRKVVYCEGYLAVLCDSVYPPFGYQGSPSDFLTALVQNHNSQVDEDKQLTLGSITVEDSNDYINRSSESALTTWEVISTRLIDTLGGYIRVRLENGVRYLDYLSDYETVSDQVIRFGENLLDLEEYISGADVVTCLIPYGAEYDLDDSAYTEQPESGTYNGNRLTIEDVNDGVGYVYSQTGIALYGRIWGTNTWDDVTEAENLLKKAQAYVDEATLSATTVTIKAVDLHLVSVDTSRIHVGDYVQVFSRPHDLSALLQCTKIKTDLSNPEDTEITLGVGQATLTGTVASGSGGSGGSSDTDDRLYYRKGDVISSVYMGAGYVSTSKTKIYFGIPLSKPIIGDPTVTVEITGASFRQEGNYTHGTSSSTSATTFDSSECTGTIRAGGVNVTITSSTTTDAVNNAVIGIFVNYTITLS